MYERFTDRARKVMQLANNEAMGMEYEYIGTGHVLVALLKEGSGIASSALRQMDVIEEAILSEIYRLAPAPEYENISESKLPQGPRVQQAIKHAIMKARDMNSSYVGTEHLLLGILCDEEFIAYKVLMNLNVSIEALTEHVTSLAQQSVSVPIEKAAYKPVKKIRISEDGAHTVDERILEWLRTPEGMSADIRLSRGSNGALLNAITIFYEDGR